MPTLLRIDSSLRSAGSHTRALCDRFVDRWRSAHPDGDVVVRDLCADPVPHLDAATLTALHAAGDPATRARSAALVAELRAADQVLIGAPLYNFGVPSTLKAWIDHVVVRGETFAFEEGSYRGLLGGRRACVVVARGGADGGASDCAVPLLRTVLAFLGLERIDVVVAEATACGEETAARALAAARAAIDGLFVEPAEPEWSGAFADEERAAIDALRRAQEAAIVAGDAGTYADLCSEDVALLLQGRPPALGRAAFLCAERELLARTRFRALRQRPLRIERQGDLVVEFGLQEVELHPQAAERAGYPARRKYVHALRRTPAGWRFALLSSSASE